MLYVREFTFYNNSISLAIGFIQIKDYPHPNHLDCKGSKEILVENKMITGSLNGLNIEVFSRVDL